jgi:hypothetical protein
MFIVQATDHKNKRSFSIKKMLNQCMHGMFY